MSTKQQDNTKAFRDLAISVDNIHEVLMNELEDKTGSVFNNYLLFKISECLASLLRGNLENVQQWQALMYYANVGLVQVETSKPEQPTDE